MQPISADKYAQVVESMRQENAGLRAAAAHPAPGQADPAQQLALQANLPGGIPEARGRIQANEQGQQYQPSGPDGKIALGTDGQPVPAGPALTPQMAQILARVTAGNSYGGNIEQQGKGAVDMNMANAGSSIVPVASGSTDPNQVGLVQRAMRGEPLTAALPGGNGTFGTMDPSSGGDLNALGQANAAAAPIKAQADAIRATGAAKDTDFVRANAVLQASQKRLQELDQESTRIQNAAVTPPQQRAAQARLSAIASERQDVQQQYEQARRMILPGVTTAGNAIGRFWKQ
jgi:hypothetical protein